MEELQKAIINHIDDGDSFDGQFIKANGFRSKQVTFRLIGVDTPESDQPLYKDASNFTRKTLLGKVVYLKVISKDVYGRFLVELYLKQGENLIDYNSILEEKGFVYVRGKHHHAPRD